MSRKTEIFLSVNDSLPPRRVPFAISLSASFSFVPTFYKNPDFKESTGRCGARFSFEFFLDFLCFCFFVFVLFCFVLFCFFLRRGGGKRKLLER